MTIANISWLASGEPFSEQFQDFYFSTDGGLQETDFVFLQQNQFPQRFTHSNHIKIGETGFGTGLNFLVTACRFLSHAPEKNTLDYLSIEKYPLSYTQLQQVYSVFKKSWPELTMVCNEFLSHYSGCLNNSKKIKLFNNRIQLNLIIDDAATGLKQLADTRYQPLDAWYLDGFSPAKNPEMWHQDLFTAIAKLSRTGTTLSTFTSAGVVRRGLLEAGFKVTKVPGPGKKREILSAIKPAVP